ncbi:MAG: SsrA-binding protein SmpB [Patescibacteria group bacterium]|nr:SsrA-binding protein SmpB [Patescibacteria group bacterium]
MPTLTVNKRALFDYEIFEKFEAGIILTGHETKSAKSGHIDIAGARANVSNNKALIVGINIPSFQPKNAPQDYDPLRTKKLILRKKEIDYLTGKINSGLTLIPISVYTKRSFVKLELGLGRSRKKSDKRELIKKREIEREIKKFKK